MSFDTAGIIESVKTRTDQYNLLRDLEALKSSVYKTGETSFENTMRTGVNNKLSEGIKNILHSVENNSDPDIISAILNDVISSVKGLKFIRIEIPVEPTELMIKKIHKCVAEKTGQGRILDIIVDKNIIGGARVTFEGKFADCTLDQAWEDMWKKIREEMEISALKK
jgi:F0F1-type ATP synthase delta subunit